MLPVLTLEFDIRYEVLRSTGILYYSSFIPVIFAVGGNEIEL